MAKRILFVEDDNIEREAYQHQLEKAGFAISVADTGPKAVDMLGKEEVDLVVLDIMIPGFDGFHVLEKIKANPKTTETPVVVLTNLDDDKFLRRAIKLGATEYLIKANTLPSQVVAHIKRLLPN
ncbi:MAG: response regulator [bacterium]|nr:response regulator [bacterium]